jgi:hypothetical protein
MSFGTRTNDSLHGVYGGMYGHREEYEVLRQQNAYEDQHRDEHSPAAIGSYNVPSFLNSSTSRPFPARAGSLLVSPDLWDSQRDSATQQRRINSLGSMDDRHHSHRDNSVPDHAAIRSREDRLAKRYAEIGPAAYIEGVTARDSLVNPRLSVPYFARMFSARPALSDEACSEPVIARDGLSVPRSRPVFSAPGPSFADKTLLAERVGAIGPTAYMERIKSQDSFRPLSWHPLPEGPALPLEAVDFSQDVQSRRLIRSLDKYYGRELNQEPGHCIDNVDDDVVAAYINAHACASHAVQSIQRIIGHEQPLSVFSSWVVRIPFLRLQYSALIVLLPVDWDAIEDVNNDVLRVLYVHLSNGSRTIPHSVTNADVEESRRRVLMELERRGFTEELPRVARLRGLSDRSADRLSGGSGWSHDTASSSKLDGRSKTSDNRSSRWSRIFAADEVREPKDHRDNKAHQDVRRGSASTLSHVFGEVSEKKKGKALVPWDHGTDSCDHSSAGSLSNTVQHGLKVSWSGDLTPSAKGNLTLTETASQGSSSNSPKKTKRKADRTPPRHRRCVSDQKSDH